MDRRLALKKESCQDCFDKSCAAEKLSSKELDIITNNRYASEIRKKTNILNEGSPTSHIIYLRSGLVKESIIKPDNNEQIIQIILPHSYLGLTSLFGDKINNCSYTALTDLKICYIDIDIFTQVVKNNGIFAFEILKSLGRENLNNYHRFIAQSNKKTYGRIADMLIYFSKVVFSNARFEIPLTRREIANMLGTSRETTGRVLTKFYNEGIITISNKEIYIRDMKKLDKISRFG
jgi:CRP-like cAMP-binding protein